MHSLGNDFIVIYEGFSELNVCEFSSDYLKTISDRKTGIGADQILLIANSDISKGEFTYKVINADGNEVEQCGNGARCVAKFLFNASMVLKNQVTLKSKAGIVSATILDDFKIGIQMTVPEFKTSDIGLKTELLESKKIGSHKIFSIRA